jgi:hypothetical protein
MTDEYKIERLFAASRNPNRVTYKGVELVRTDKFPLKDAKVLQLVIETENSDWPQAIRILSPQPIEIGGEVGTNFALWTGAAPREVRITCIGHPETVTVFNAWDPSGSGKPFSGLASGAMIVEEIPDGRRYRCNDSYPDEDFDDLVFRVERLPD